MYSWRSDRWICMAFLRAWLFCKARMDRAEGRWAVGPLGRWELGGAGIATSGERAETVKMKPAPKFVSSPLRLQGKASVC